MHFINLEMLSKKCLILRKVMMKQMFLNQKIATLLFAIVGLVSPHSANATAASCNTIFGDFVLTTQEYQILDQIRLAKTLNSNIFRDSTPNQVAKSLIYKLREQEVKYQKELLSRKDQEQVNLETDSEILLFFDFKIADSIAQRGFLNQHLTGNSAGMNNTKFRKLAEDWYSDLKLGDSTQALQLRPKSAYLNISTDKFLGKRRSLPHLQFGTVAAVFKDSVKDQSIWTAYNSLEVGKIIGSVSNAKGALSSLLNKCTQCVLGKDIIDPNISGKSLLPYKGTFKANRISTIDHDTYHEVLVYGEITFKDVKHFLITDPFQAHKLVKYGKPIYFAEAIDKHSRPYYKKNALLFDGIKASDPSYNKLLGL